MLEARKGPQFTIAVDFIGCSLHMQKLDHSLKREVKRLDFLRTERRQNMAYPSHS